MAAVGTFLIPDGSVSFAGPLALAVQSFCNLGLAPPPVVLPDFRVVFATPIDSNTIRVFFSKEPRHISPLSSTDVLNRLNWVLSIVTGPGKLPEFEKVENAQARPDLVGSVDDAGTIGAIPTGWSVDVRTARRILEKTTYLIVASSVIVSADGLDSMAASPNDRAEHPGVHVERDPVRRRPVVVRNAGTDFRYDFFEGRYILDPKADIDVHAGVEFLKKRVIRRLISNPGGFFHLPNYGVGLKVKQTFNAAEIGRIQNRITEQIRQEEDVEEMELSVASPASGVLVIRLKVQTARGEGFSIGLEVPEDGQVVLL